MTKKQRIKLLQGAKAFFRDELLYSHFNGGLERASNLENYSINPFLYKYLAAFLKGNTSPKSIAEALIYPRILGSSINTTFGMQIQKHIGKMFKGFAGSAIAGIDIEFIDAIDKTKKYCQIKSGPNTINSGDVDGITEHFKRAKRIAKQNHLRIADDDLIVGVIYGEPEELSSHYRKLANDFPVYIGKDFWHRLTGKDDFYEDLINAVGEIAIEIDASKQLRAAIAKLEKQIAKKSS